MFLLVLALGIDTPNADPTEPWPQDCVEGAACDPMHSRRFADPGDHEGVFALTNMAEVFTSDHYPVDALRAGKQGRVRVRMEVSAEGDPVKCTVIKSSRVASLDEATCDRLMAAGKFKTAHDRNGHAKSYSTTMKVSWSLPAFEPFRERRMKAIIPIDQAGSMGVCRVEIIIRGATAPPPCPDQLLAQARHIIASAPSVEFIANRELVIEEGLLIGEASQFGTVGRGIGDQLLMSAGLAIEIDAGGKVRSCRKMGDQRTEPFEAQMCNSQLKHRYSPLAKRDPNRLPREAMYYFAIYTRGRPANPAADSK